MAATNNKADYASSGAVTITLASLATSSTWVAGRESNEIDNSTNKYLDYIISGKITVGTTPTANTVIEVWVIPRMEDGSYPDVFDGTDSAETVTAREMLFTSGGLLAPIPVVATTSDVGYPFWGTVNEALGCSVCPAKFALFVVHNTGVNLNSTGSNQAIYAKGLFSTSGG